MKASNSLAVKGNITILGIPIAAYFFPSQSARLLKIFQVSPPEKSDKQETNKKAQDGPIDESFNKALGQLTDYYDFETSSWFNYVKTLEVTGAWVELPILISDCISPFQEAYRYGGQEPKRTIKLPNNGGNIELKLIDFAIPADPPVAPPAFKTLITDGNIDATTKKIRKEALLLWYLSQVVSYKPQEGDAIISAFFNKIDYRFKQWRYKLKDTWLNESIEAVHWNILYGAYRNKFNKVSGVSALPSYLKDELNKAIRDPEKWPDAIKTIEGLEIKAFRKEEKPSELVYLTYQGKVLSERHFLCKIDLELATNVPKHKDAETYKRLKDAWKKCRTFYYGSDDYKIYPNDISWEDWQESYVSHEDPFYRFEPGYPIKITDKYKDTEKTEDECRIARLKDNANKTNKDFFGTIVGEAAAANNDKELANDDGKKEKPGFISYFSGEFIYRRDFSSTQRVLLSRLYNDESTGFAASFPLHDNWRDKKKDWKYPTLEERMLQALSDFSGS